MIRLPESKNIDPIFLERWSSKNFKKEPIPREDLKTIFEAARWSPSCYNEQPWLFVYTQETEKLKEFQDSLTESNRVWASHAPILIFTFAKKIFSRNEKKNRWAMFDTGAAWMSLALQAHKLGYTTRAMGGFDSQKAFEITKIDPKKYDVMAVIALGYRCDKKPLSENTKTTEEPSSRKPLCEIIMER
jgi:nitroreductase